MVDAVQEFKVRTDNYSEQYGGIGGAQADYVLKSGTNLHFLPPDGRSTRYDRHDFVTLAYRPRCIKAVKAVIRVSCLVIRENLGLGGWFAPGEMFGGALTDFASPLGEKCTP